MHVWAIGFGSLGIGQGLFWTYGQPIGLSLEGIGPQKRGNRTAWKPSVSKECPIIGRVWTVGVLALTLGDGWFANQTSASWPFHMPCLVSERRDIHDRINSVVFCITLFGRSRCMLGPKLYSQLAVDLGVACDISAGPECYEPLAGSPLRLPGRLSTQLCHQYPQKALEWRRGCNTQLAGLELCRSPTRQGVFAPAETINMTLQELVQAGKRCQIPVSTVSYWPAKVMASKLIHCPLGLCPTIKGLLGSSFSILLLCVWDSRCRRA